ncbi:MAG: TPM domain-containing protein [Candidatus Eremiobacteraeota bacterium]|nr:TPM domain-containing protein [Candidatus Eremiobacteraeota bacterium]
MNELNVRKRTVGALIASLLLVVSLAVPAAARSGFVQDGAHLFSTSTISSLDTTIGNFNAQTGKEIVIVTVPSLEGQTPQAAAQSIFAQQQVNGVLIFLAKAERVQGIVPGRAAAAFFPSGTIASIREAMRGYFRAGDFDGGITTGVNLILAQYRSHVGSLGAATSSQRSPARARSSGGGMSLLWLILILIAGFLIIRAVFRAISGRAMTPPGYGGGPGGAGGPGYGPGYGGYGPGYGGFGGGGGFFSGLLGGLGGAFLGNELFGRQNMGVGGPDNTGIVPGADAASAPDAGGWQNDAGQADMGNASFGDIGGGGGGDFGGGGGGDFGGGGGGGDSGGGW